MAAGLLTDEPLELANVPDLADIASMPAACCSIWASSATHVAGRAAAACSLHAPRDPSTDGALRPRAQDARLGPGAGAAAGALPARPRCRCRAAAPSARGRSTCTSRASSGWGPRSSSRTATSTPRRRERPAAGREIRLPQPSVGATENLLMAAALAEGETRDRNAAREPEIVDLAHCLVRAWAREIEGAGTEQHPHRGRAARCTAPSHPIIPDRIEAGTYAMAAAITGGELVLQQRPARASSGAAKELLEAAGMMLERRPRAASWPASPTAACNGSDVMTAALPRLPHRPAGAVHGPDERGRRRGHDHRDHLREPLHARARSSPAWARGSTSTAASALVRGVSELTGAPVMATDLRASVSLVLAGLAAKGETEINRVYHLDRGYERLEEKLGGRRRQDRAGALSSRTRARMGDKLRLQGRRCRGSGGDRRLPAGRPDVALREMVFSPDERRFAAAFNRYRREQQAGTGGLRRPDRVPGRRSSSTASTRSSTAASTPTGPTRSWRSLTIATEPGKRPPASMSTWSSRATPRSSSAPTASPAGWTISASRSPCKRHAVRPSSRRLDARLADPRAERLDAARAGLRRRLRAPGRGAARGAGRRPRGRGRDHRRRSGARAMRRCSRYTARFDRSRLTPAELRVRRRARSPPRRAASARPRRWRRSSSRPRGSSAFHDRQLPADASCDRRRRRAARPALAPLDASASTCRAARPPIPARC